MWLPKRTFTQNILSGDALRWFLKSLSSKKSSLQFRGTFCCQSFFILDVCYFKSGLNWNSQSKGPVLINYRFCVKVKKLWNNSHFKDLMAEHLCQVLFTSWSECYAGNPVIENTLKSGCKSWGTYSFLTFVK